MPSRTKTIINSMRYVTERPSLLRKFFAPKVGRGKTIWPLTDKQLLRYGFWWDFDGVFTKEEGDFFKYQLQLNAGKIPSTLALWRKTIGGTHATLTSMYIPVATEPDVEIFQQALKTAIDEIP